MPETEPDNVEQASVNNADVNQEEKPDLPDFDRNASAQDGNDIDFLKDVDLDVKVELGRTELTIEEILGLSNGSVVQLNSLAGDPVDVLVNEQLVARGEVLVINENLCVRINEIVPGATEKMAQA